MKLGIARLVKNRFYREALETYTRLHSASSSPTKFTFPYILKACAELEDVYHGQMLHAHILKTGHQRNRHTATDLVNMYMKLQLPNNASKLFDEIPDPHLSAFNVLITGFSQNGCFQQALSVFRVLSVHNSAIDSVTVASALSACKRVEDGEQVQCLAIKIGVEMDVYAATSLMTMYLNCGELVSARKLFGLIEGEHLVCYNAFLSGLVQNRDLEGAFLVFNELRRSVHQKPTAATMIPLLSACANAMCLKFGCQIHGLIVKDELVFDAKVGTGLVDMYSKCGSWQCAYSVFKEMGCNRSLITWNSMIAGMMLNDQSEIAVSLFSELEHTDGLKPDSATWNSLISGFSQLGKADQAFLFFRKMLYCAAVPSLRCITSLLAACSSVSALSFGKQLHAYVARMNLTNDDFVATAIIDMYMKCGQHFHARNVFNQYRIKPNDPAFWNAMISGYGKNGKNEDAFDIFNQMMESKTKPNSVTLNCLLSVCSHTGQVEQAFQIFRQITVEYGLNPSFEHLNVLIDLLGRAGRLDEAFELLQGTSDQNSASAFASLLGACELHSDSKLGEEIARKLSEMDPENPIPSVILYKLYAAQEKWKEADTIRKVMDEKGLRKDPGLSSTTSNINICVV